MTKLNKALSTGNINNANKLMTIPGQIDDKTLNHAVVTGLHYLVTNCLKAGAKPDPDTLKLALFTAQPHFIITELLEAGAPIDKETIRLLRHSSQLHSVKTAICREYQKISIKEMAISTFGQSSNTAKKLHNKINHSFFTSQQSAFDIGKCVQDVEALNYAKSNPILVDLFKEFDSSIFSSLENEIRFIQQVNHSELRFGMRNDGSIVEFSSLDNLFRFLDENKSANNLVSINLCGKRL